MVSTIKISISMVYAIKISLLMVGTIKISILSLMSSHFRCSGNYYSVIFISIKASYSSCSWSFSSWCNKFCPKAPPVFHFPHVQSPQKYFLPIGWLTIFSPMDIDFADLFYFHRQQKCRTALPFHSLSCASIGTIIDYKLYVYLYCICTYIGTIYNFFV